MRCGFVGRPSVTISSIGAGRVDQPDLPKFRAEEWDGAVPNQTGFEHNESFVPFGARCDGCPKDDPHGITGYSGDVFCHMQKEVVPGGEAAMQAKSTKGGRLSTQSGQSLL